MLNLHSWCFSVYLCSSRFIFWSVVVVVVNKCAATRCCLSLFIGVNPSTSFSGVRKSRLLQVLWRVKAEGRPTVNICSSRAPQRTRKCPATSLPLSISVKEHLHCRHIKCLLMSTWSVLASSQMSLTLICLYRPSSSRCESYHPLNSMWKGCDFDKEVILMGDFNVNWEDKSGTRSLKRPTDEF